MKDLWKYGLVFAGGVAVGVYIYKNTQEVKAACVKALGNALDIKDKTIETVEILKESAQDILAQANAERKNDAAKTKEDKDAKTDK
jgi:hypothetical protein